jgi:pimeloyl-ACP methyl ester carboxylesterase
MSWNATVVTTILMFCLAHSTVARADRNSPDTFDSDGCKISYIDEGQGTPVVLIHGWHASAELNWGLPGLIGALSKDYRVIAIDVRGHGRSDKPTDENEYGTNLVDDVERLLDHLKIKKAHIVGYSMGGIITANFVVKHPERVISSVLGGMGCMIVGRPAQLVFAQVGKNDSEPRPAILCGRSLAKLALTDKEIKDIQVPVTILIGDDDRIIKRLYVEPTEELRSDWPVIEIADVGHMLCVAKPQFRDELLAALKKHPK